MISSIALRNFVKVHEHRLDAKIQQAKEDMAVTHNSDLEAAHWGSDCIDGRHDTHIRQAANHWQIDKSASVPARRRPKSSYFNFILTPTHQ